MLMGMRIVFEMKLIAMEVQIGECFQELQNAVVCAVAAVEIQ